MRNFIDWCLDWFVATPGEDGVSSEYQCDDPCDDVQRRTRIFEGFYVHHIPDDKFDFLKRPKS